MKRRDIQSAHEESVLDSFGAFLKNQGVTFEVLERPDPPDAIIKLNNNLCWVEITDAFQSADWARSVTSYPAEDKDHIPHRRGVIYNPDRAACEKVKEVILNKYNKKTMNDLLNSLGQGILLVGAYTPLTSPEEIVEMASEAIVAEILDKTPVFEVIYLYRNSSDGHVFVKLF